MKTTWNWRTIVGLVLHVGIAGLMIFAAAMKLFGPPPPQDVIDKMGGLAGQMRLIAAGELACAVLLLIPRTSSLGVLLTSSFWGGAICAHMFQGDSYVLQSVLLFVTWVGAYLRVPGTLGSFTPPSAVARPSEEPSEAAVS